MTMTPHIFFHHAARAARALRSSAKRSEAWVAFVFALTLPLIASAADAPRPPRPRSKDAPAPAPAAAPAAPGNNADFAAFRLVTERNIFNPNRTGRGRDADEAPPPRTETIALVGTLDSSTRGRQALFDSADAAYRKALAEGDTLAGYTVKKIHPDRVELAAGDKTAELSLSQQLRRTAGGEWTIAARELPRPSAAPSAAAPAAEPPPIPAGASDLLRRLMEQRQKQLKQ
jgi:hypothetical protein